MALMQVVCMPCKMEWEGGKPAFIARGIADVARKLALLARKPATDAEHAAADACSRAWESRRHARIAGNISVAPARTTTPSTKSPRNATTPTARNRFIRVPLVFPCDAIRVVWGHFLRLIFPCDGSFDPARKH
jgi:hypothetical protein